MTSNGEPKVTGNIAKEVNGEKLYFEVSSAETSTFEQQSTILPTTLTYDLVLHYLMCTTLSLVTN